ncbi:MAG: aldehyde dehydrogenase family protein, partial [Candidatus Eremiobacterota bacterium]
QEVGQVCLAGPEEFERAAALAEATFRTGRPVTRHQRSRWLSRIAEILEERAEDFARLIVAEAGKPLQFARGEVQRAVATFELAAAEALVFAGHEVPLDAAAAGQGYLGLTRRVPAGPVAAISPVNFPLNLVAHKVAPALAVGCPVLAKPAPATPLTALKLAEVCRDAGVPPGWLSVLAMDNAHAGLLVDDPRLKVLSFTGSDRVGWELKARARWKKVLLELGGNAPVLIHSDADLDFAVPRLAVGGYAYAGQVCISVQRVLVHQDVYEPFVERFVEAVKGLAVGDPADEKTVVGPMIHPREVERVGAWVEAARQKGARVLCGGRGESPVYHPTVLDRVDPELEVNRCEVFGPVTLVTPYRDFRHGLELANDSPFGLQAGVFTRDLDRVLAAFDELDFGGIIVNDYPTFRVDNMPYGGVKHSGFGREGLRYAMDEMSELRLLAIRR